jgi:hypothetical protein
MPDTKKWNPYAAAAAALSSKDKNGDKKPEAKPEPQDARSEAREESDLTENVKRLKEYKEKKKLGDSATSAEVRLFNLQSKRVKSYKHGTKKVSKTGLAKLHKGEAVLPVKEAKKYRRGGKVSAAASSLGSGKKKVPSKTQRLVRAAGKELKDNPPKVLGATLRKKGPKQANKQRVAIMLSKARAAGADIPEND